MARRLSVCDSIVIDVAPSTVYDAVSDPTRTGDWSPENLGATIVGTFSGVGTVFVGQNKRGRARWVTRCRVTAADPGVRFAFTVQAIGVRRPRVPAQIASWAYDLEPTLGGTKVTETWTDDRARWPDLVADMFDRVVTGGQTFADFNTRNIQTTLHNLKAALEQ